MLRAQQNYSHIRWCIYVYRYIHIVRLYALCVFECVNNFAHLSAVRPFTLLFAFLECIVVFLCVDRMMRWCRLVQLYDVGIIFLGVVWITPRPSSVTSAELQVCADWGRRRQDQNNDKKMHEPENHICVTQTSILLPLNLYGNASAHAVFGLCYLIIDHMMRIRAVLCMCVMVGYYPQWLMVLLY